MHLSKIRLFEVKLLCKSVKVNCCRIKNDFLDNSFDSLNEVFIWLKILLSILEHDFEESSKNWPLHALDFLISTLNLAKIKLLENVLSLGSTQLPS